MTSGEPIPEPYRLTERVLLLGLFLFAIFLSTVHPFSDSDQLYHLKVGRVIWETKSIPMADIFSYTAPGVRWITHEWLAELIFYGFYQLAGFWGAIYLVAAMAAATMWILYSIAVDWGADRGIGALLLFLFSYLTFDWWLVRPQIFAYLSFALLLYFLERYRHRSHVVYLYAAVLAMWFWANVNASFILGLVVLGLYWTLTFLKRDVAGSTRAFGLCLAAATAICFVNPNGYRIFLYSWYVQPVVKALNIFEWRPILMYLGDPHIEVLLAEMAIADLFVIFWFGVRKQSRDLVFLGLTLGVSLMPFLSVRHYAFWPLAIMAPLLIGISAALANSLARIGRARLYPVLLGIGVFFLLLRVYTFPQSPIQQTPLPILGADFVDRIGLKGPRYNLYDEGGYLIWQSWPREKVFIDGRSEIFAGRPLQEFLDIKDNAPDWDALVNDKYHINYFFLAYRPQGVANSIMPLIGKLVSERWALIYWDDATLVYVRNVAQNDALIHKYALYYVSPFRDPSTITPGEIPAAKQNLAKALSAAPNSQVLRSYCGQIPGGC